MNDNCNHSALEKAMTFRYLGMLAVVASMAIACTEVKIENKPPVASAELTTALEEGGFVALDGETATIEIDGSGSSDPDGRVVSYEWFRTDVSAAARHGLGDAGMPPDDLDPPPDPSFSVTLPAGDYRFSLWVTDDDGAVSAPASVSVRIGEPEGPGFMPDETCMQNYPNPNQECAECICSPMEQGGCLEDYQLCFENDDMEFSSLCSAVVACALENDCMGGACYTPAFCMAEIDAAGMYNGGAGAAECQGGDPETNPCAAVSQRIAVCTPDPARCGEFCN